MCIRDSGYAVQGDTVDPAVGEVSHVNANDNTVEGVRYKNKSCFTVQFHPEASAGPQDTSYLFDEFIAMMKKAVSYTHLRIVRRFKIWAYGPFSDPRDVPV